MAFIAIHVYLSSENNINNIKNLSWRPLVELTQNDPREYDYEMDEIVNLLYTELCPSVSVIIIIMLLGQTGRGCMFAQTNKTDIPKNKK